jgi:hypothetical protein
MAGTIKSLAGPVALANGTYVTNIYNPFSANIYGVITRIHIINTTAGALTFRLYKGATGANTAGTELYYNVSVAANTAVDYYMQDRYESTDFLVGGASGAGLTIKLDGIESVK